MLKLPSFIKPIPSQPNDPPLCKNYAFLLEDSFNMMVRYYPIPVQYTNPYDEKKTIDIIHQQLEEDQGLIEVEKGLTQNGLRFIAVITKNYMGPEHGVQYFLRLNVFRNQDEDWAHEINAFFGEEGITGQRDSFVMAMLGMPKDWTEDPYDKNYTKGVRMNKSEEQKYDSKFPNHPLSQARKFITFIKENN